MSDNAAQTKSVVIERTFDAPVDLIWKMWTDGDHFKKWYGPKGATLPVANLDLSIGGKRLVCMEMNTPKGTMTMWMTGKFTRIDPTTHLSYTESMSDKDGNVLDPAAMGMPNHPKVTEVHVVLEASGQATKMVMTHEGVPADSPGAGGWQQAFDKLAELIA